MSFTEHGACTTCGREFRLRKDGRIWHHLSPRNQGSPYRSRVCPGATREPAPVAE